MAEIESLKGPLNRPLTTGIDRGAAFTGTDGNDLFVGNTAAGATALTALDALDGGAGTDTLEITDTTSIDTTAATGATVTGIENVVLTSNGAITANTTAWTGATSVTSLGGATRLTAAATTNVSATATGNVTVTGGAAIVAATAASDLTISDAAGAVTASVSGQAAKNITIDGGTSVAVSSTGNVLGGAGTAKISVGSTTAPTGAVSVAVSGNYTDGGNSEIGAITVKGGSTVSVTQTTGITAAEATAAVTDLSNSKVIQGDVTVTGTAATTSVSVTQAQAVDKVQDGTAGVIGVDAANVTVNDVNRTSATKAGTISSVSLTNFAAAAVDSGALTSLTLAGKGASVNAGTLGVLDTPNTSLALNLNGATISGAVTIDADIATLNVAAASAASTVGSLAASGVTALNISGDKSVTLTAQTIGTAVITSTNTAGVSLGTALATGSQFVGGDGADTITLTTSFTKAHSLGAGDDTVTYADQGTGGSVNFGDGANDALLITSALAATADNTTVFNSKFTNFEVLALSDALAAGTTLNLDTLGGVSKIVLAAGGASATTAILDNVASGATIDTRSASTGFVAQVKGALTGTADVLNVKLTNSTGGVVGFGSVTAANVETVSLSTVDAGTAGNVAATVDTATLVATSATSVTVSGNNGLNLTNTGNTAITSFDASGVVADTAKTSAGADVDTAANLAVTFASANTTATATVTITGGAGNDVLTGNAAKDTILGGAGNDEISGGAGVDTLSGEAGNDTLNGGDGNDVMDGGAGNDTITGGLGADTISIGSGRDVVAIAAATTSSDSTTAASDSVSGFTLAGAIAVASAADLATATKFQAAAATVIGANVSALSIDLDGAAAADVAITVEADITAATGQAAGVTYSVTKGILTLGGAGASAVDTLGEWLTEAAAVAATDGDILAFEFGGSTYVFAQNGANDVLTKLDGVTGAAALVELSGTTSNVANAIYYFDIA